MAHTIVVAVRILLTDLPHWYTECRQNVLRCTGRLRLQVCAKSPAILVGFRFTGNPGQRLPTSSPHHFRSRTASICRRWAWLKGCRTSCMLVHSLQHTDPFKAQTRKCPTVLDGDHPLQAIDRAHTQTDAPMPACAPYAPQAHQAPHTNLFSCSRRKRVEPPGFFISAGTERGTNV